MKRFLTALLIVVMSLSVSLPASAKGPKGPKGDRGNHYGWYKPAPREVYGYGNDYRSYAPYYPYANPGYNYGYQPYPPYGPWGSVEAPARAFGFGPMFWYW